MENNNNNNVVTGFILPVIMALIIAGGVFLYTIYQKDQQIKNEEPQEVILVQAEDVINGFYANEVKAKDDYFNKWLSVDGAVYDISSKGKNAEITFRNGESFNFKSLRCTLTSEEDIEIVKGLVEGDRVTVRGQIAKKFFGLGDMNIKYCTIE